LVTSGALPETVTLPEVGFTKPFSNLAKVDFPEPLVPMMATDLEVSSKLMSDKAM
jgi:hypothetical protein